MANRNIPNLEEVNLDNFDDNLSPARKQESVGRQFSEVSSLEYDFRRANLAEFSDESDFPLGIFIHESSPEIRSVAASDHSKASASVAIRQSSFRETDSHGTPFSCSFGSSPEKKISHSSAVSYRVTVFNLRCKAGMIVKGKVHTLDVQHHLIKQRIASSYNAPEQSLILKTLGGDERDLTEDILVSILDELCQDFIALYICYEDHDTNQRFYTCINISCGATTQDLINAYIEAWPHHNIAPKSFWPFHKRRKLISSALLCEQKVEAGSLILLQITEPKIIKCLYRASFTSEHLYIINCLTTDSVDELKGKIRKTIIDSSKDKQLVKLIASSYMWLTLGIHIYQDDECIQSPVLNDTASSVWSHLGTYYDVVAHFQPQDAIPINVKYTDIEGHSSCDKIVIKKCIASVDFRQQISSLLHCAPNALKITVNKKRLPERRSLQSCCELRADCTIEAVSRHPIIVNVKFGKETHQISIFKLDTVLMLKQKLATQIGKRNMQIKLSSGGKELDDYQLIEQAHIKDDSEVLADIYEDRIIINMRKRGSKTHYFVLDDIKNVRVRDLKLFYKNVVNLSPRVDIEFYSTTLPKIYDDNDCLCDIENMSSEQINILYALEKHVDSRATSSKRIYRCRESGDVEIKRGVVVHNKIYYAPDNDNENDDENPEEDCPDDMGSLLHRLCYNGIRQAYQHEIDTMLNRISEDISVEISCPFPSTSQALVPYTFQEHGDATEPCVTRSDPRPHPWLVTDEDLDRLVKQLPGNEWQPFMRELVPHEIITKYSNSNTISEQMFNCLKVWKNREGVKAKKSTLQTALIKHDLRLTSDTVFGELDNGNMNV
ncbi:uncharacterized protein LOC126822649 [Patella vulgata]|uniref:uncharacterized protein LOC126822649 n=1 Tax=Patella vulgata TaxID=6465 RepID=UPI00217FDE7A|nr:uncharacterized protein LOC126822649 [Patella vulgata]XP_050407587.1 uncharacterized protein LOC126822649 [Patella vulgata]